MEEECIQVVCEELLPLCTLVTPNLPEAELLMRQKKERESNRDKKTMQALDAENGKESDLKRTKKDLRKAGRNEPCI